MTKAIPTMTPQIAAQLIAAMSMGEPLGEVNVVRQGDQIILPKDMATSEAITWLQRKLEAEESVVELNEYIEGFPLDVAHALALAVKELFGFRAVSDFWPRSISLEINSDGDTEQVYIGEFKVPTIEGTITTKWAGPISLNVQARIKQKDQGKLKNLINHTRKMLQTNSVYRGKAFELQFDGRTGNPMAPKFIKTVTPGMFQGNNDVLDLLDNVWTVIRKTERCRQENIPLKRGVLLEGPYGTGKSLFGAETAAIAAENGWTFISLKHIAWLAQAYEFARFYAPAVLFGEDIDLAVDQESGELTSDVRNTIDGVATKRAEVLMILTTNYPEKLPKSVLRPGRLDAVIPFRAPDPHTVDTLLRQYGRGLIAPSVDLTEVSHRLQGKIPAVIREVVERAKIHMVAREASFLTARDLDLAAKSMLHHMNLFEGQTQEKPSFAEQWGGAMGDKIGSHVATALKRAAHGQDEYLDPEAERQITERHREAVSAHEPVPVGAGNGLEG
jgi:transitional endoplasmic reticulum ATPase